MAAKSMLLVLCAYAIHFLSFRICHPLFRHPDFGWLPGADGLKLTLTVGVKSKTLSKISRNGPTVQTAYLRGVNGYGFGAASA